MIHRLLTATFVGLIVLGAGACGDDNSGSNNTGDPAPAACLVDDPTCFEIGIE